MVTKQQQLEWLANNLDKWKSGYDFAVVDKCTDGSFYVRWPSVCSSGITKKEWKRERDKMNSKPEVDSSWHERGELPPVGCECEIKHKYWVEFQRVSVLAITSEYVIISGHPTPAREQHYHLRDITFRPLRTEREKAIDEMKSLCAYPGSWCSTYKSFAEALYDAGYRKVKP